MRWILKGKGMDHFLLEQSPPRTVSPRRKITHTEQFTSVDHRVFDKEIQREAQESQEFKSKDIKKVFPTPFDMFSARVPPEERERNL